MNTRLSLASAVSLLVCAGPSAASARDTASEPDRAPYLSPVVRCIFQDRAGDLWFGSELDGVGRYDGESLRYDRPADGLAGRSVRAITEDRDGALWFATNGGVSRLHDGAFATFTAADGLPHDDVWSLLFDRAGTLWVGTRVGVSRFDGESFVPVPIPRAAVERPDARVSPTLVWTIHEDQAGHLWFGTDGEGARRFDGESFTTYTTKDGLAGDRVQSITGDRRGGVWLGSSSGVSRFADGSFETFTQDDGLGEGSVWTMLADRAGNVWIATLGAGVTRYDGESFTSFAASDGLRRSDVLDIFEDRDGTLWLGCTGGLFRLDGDAFVDETWHGPAPAERTSPLPSFARMVDGDWRMKAQWKTGYLVEWNWNPATHSIRVDTSGLDPEGNPWRELEVMYWHPAHKEVRLIALHPDIPYVGRGFAEGTMRFDGEIVDAVFDLYQPRGRRELNQRWTFGAPGSYHKSLWEAPGDAVLRPLAEWNYARSETPTLVGPRVDQPAPAPSQNLRALDRLLGHTFESTDGRNRFRSTVEWVPLLDVVHLRSASLAEEGEPAHLFDAYVYHHVGTGSLGALVLSSWGAVYEGDVTTLENGAVELDLEGHDGKRVDRHVVRLEFQEDRTLRQRIWSVNGEERALVLDLGHMKR